MSYKVIYMPKVQEQLKRMDRNQARIIVAWTRKKLEGASDPRQYGKSLIEDENGKWSFRIGKYRVLANIDDSKIMIEALSISHGGTL